VAVRRFDCGSGVALIRTTNKVNVGRWNTVTINRREWSAWISLNNGTQAAGRSKVCRRGIAVNYLLTTHRVIDTVLMALAALIPYPSMHAHFITSTPTGVRSSAMIVSACVSVCLFIRSHISKMTSKLQKIFCARYL